VWRVLRAQGKTVSGSDLTQLILHALAHEGIEVPRRLAADRLPRIAICLYSEAVPESAPERIEAAKRGIRQLDILVLWAS
jgi:UDP-N-acetylmuramate-alanine ligase